MPDVKKSRHAAGFYARKAVYHFTANPAPGKAFAMSWIQINTHHIGAWPTLGLPLSDTADFPFPHTVTLPRLSAGNAVFPHPCSRVKILRFLGKCV